MEDSHTPPLWVIFIHDTNDCNISVTNPMHRIYLTSVSSEVRLFVCRVCCNTLQKRSRAAMCGGVCPLWRWWPVFCSGSQETEGITKCMRHFEKQACKIPHHQARRLCFMQTKLSLEYLSLGWLYVTIKSDQMPIQLAADTKGRCWSALCSWQSPEPEDIRQDIKVLVNLFCIDLSNPFINLLGLNPEPGNEWDSSVSFGNELPSKK